MTHLRTLPYAMALVLCLPSSSVAFAQESPPPAQPTTDLAPIEVKAKLFAAANGLSPTTGSSQFTITANDIDHLALGATTPLNQVLLQAPGVVQDSYGSIHVRGDHANIQYRINGVIVPESISGFGQTIDPRVIETIHVLDGALPAEYGERSSAIVDITTKNAQGLKKGGTIGMTAGSFGTFSPFAADWGHADRWSWFATTNYMRNRVGLENPTPLTSPLHDVTHQVKGFADISYLLNDTTQFSLMAGVTNNRFQIPTTPGLTPAFDDQGLKPVDSADLNERQQEQTRFGIVALQGLIGETTYQLSFTQRYSAVDYQPDVFGNLIYNGIASQIDRSNRAKTIQADFSTPLSASHTLHYGLYGDREQAHSFNQSWVFPGDDDGNQTSNKPISVGSISQFTTTSLALYLQDKWQITDRFAINLGARANRYRGFGQQEGQLSPRIGTQWQLTPSTTVHAGYARYFTPPATELISGTDISIYQGTTNQHTLTNGLNPLSERSHYYDVGIIQGVGDDLKLGLDFYRRHVSRLQDEGQFGSAYIYSTFNYRLGDVRGGELSASYNHGRFDARVNLALSKAIGKQVITEDYNFEPDERDYIAKHWIHLDHDQRLTASGHLGYQMTDRTALSTDYLFGSGLRKDGPEIPNGAAQPGYGQVNAAISHDFFDLSHPLHLQFAVINLLDRKYQLRDGSGVGVLAPQWGPRRGVYLTVQQSF